MPKPPRLAPQSSAPGLEVGIQRERRANVVQSGGSWHGGLLCSVDSLVWYLFLASLSFNYVRSISDLNNNNTPLFLVC